MRESNNSGYKVKIFEIKHRLFTRHVAAVRAGENRKWGFPLLFCEIKFDSFIEICFYNRLSLQ